MKTKLLVVLIAIGVFLPFVAQAVPCGYGGVSPSAGCRDGGDGIKVDTENYLNGIIDPPHNPDNTTPFFGFNDWEELDKTDDGIDTSYWFGDFTGTDGDFTLNAGIWLEYEHLLVVLKDGGSSTDPDIYWSAYLLEDGQLYHTWEYDGIKELSHATLYGSGDPSNPVPEPATMLLFGIGLVGLAGYSRRRAKK